MSTEEIFLRLAVPLFLGMLIGFERIYHGEELPKFLPISKELGWNKRDGWKKDRKNPYYLFQYTCKKFLGKSVDWAYSYYCSQPKRYCRRTFWRN